MTQPGSTFATNDMVGIREDLVDVIYDVSPIETPFLSMASKVTATNTNHEWQVDALVAASSANAVVEGDDATTDAGTATTRRGNYTQISDKVARVTGTARAVKTAGRADEFDYQLLKRGRELKRDIETILLSNKAKVAGSDTVAREMAGVVSWIFTNVDKVGANPAGDGSNAATDGTQRVFTEDQLKSVAKLAWDNGGEPDTLLTGSFNRQIASSFGAGTKVQKVEDSTLHTSFDVYESDFGSLKLIPDRFCVARDVYILDMEYWKVAYLPGRNMLTTPLAKTGDTDRTQILCEYTLEACNEKSSGIVRDLTTS